ncbi:hypothetical protein ONZ45_g4886 [Pleurotus djamor]|nr:hypothetical protein ONZ45_g4886 [Pleurotus djamor]
MSSSWVTINIWSVNINNTARIKQFQVPNEGGDLEALIQRQLGWPDADIYRPCRDLTLPARLTREDISTFQRELNDHLELEPWSGARSDLGAIFFVTAARADNEEGGPRTFTIYNAQTRKLEFPSLHSDGLICTKFPYAFKVMKRLVELVSGVTLGQHNTGLTSLALTVVSVSVACIPLGYHQPGSILSAMAKEDTEEAEEADTLSPMTNIMNQRRKFFANIESMDPSLSVGGKPLLDPLNKVLAGRSLTYDMVPPSLYDQTLCQLRFDIHHIEPSAADFADYHNLRSSMIRAYYEEAYRSKSFYAATERFLPSYPLGFHKDELSMPGALSISFQKHNYMIVITDAIPEIGLSQVEPCVRAGRYYLEYWRKMFSVLKSKLDHCNLPIIILSQVGSYLSVLVGCASGPEATPKVEFLTCVPLHVDDTNIEAIKVGARVIGALRKAAASLQERYPALLSNGKAIPFTYQRQERGKKIFYATRDDTKDPICVKFSLRYSEDAHRSAAEAGISPKILSCERHGDWYMVVMEDLSDYMALWNIKGTLNHVQRKMVQSEIKTRLETLHAHGYVHGDVRTANILVHKCMNEDTKDFSSLKLVDWEWGGPEGTVIYPHHMNEDIIRPEAAVSGAKIDRTHDIEMLAYLFKDDNN